jgi:hypothetical protein
MKRFHFMTACGWSMDLFRESKKDAIQAFRALTEGSVQFKVVETIN